FFGTAYTPAHWKMTTAGNLPSRAGLAKYPCAREPRLSSVKVANSTPGLPPSPGVSTGFMGTSRRALTFASQKASKSAGRGAAGPRGGGGGRPGRLRSRLDGGDAGDDDGRRQQARSAPQRQNGHGSTPFPGRGRTVP